MANSSTWRWKAGAGMILLSFRLPTLASDATTQWAQSESREHGTVLAEPYSEGGAIMLPFSASSDARVPVVTSINAKESDTSFIPSALGIVLMVVVLVLLIRKTMS